MNMNQEKIIYVDDEHESISTLFRLRAPALFVGLVLGFGITFLTSSFEKVLEENIYIAFFLPFIIYIADAVGAQTNTIYARDLRKRGSHFMKFLKKEFVLGIIFGLSFSILTGLVSYLWLGNKLLSLSILIATFLSIFIAPISALLIAQLFQSLHKDPAASASPVSTVIQDMISVIIYGFVCSLILL
jgi:magnesium transporter